MPQAAARPRTSFDVEGARRNGYSDAEILEHLASTRHFDVQGARKAGYSDAEIFAHLSGSPASSAKREDMYQYVKLPDGSYAKFRADASDDAIRGAVTKDFPDAFNGTKFDPRGMSLPGGTPQLNIGAQLLHLPSAMPTKFEQDRDPANQPGLLGTLSNKFSALGDKAQGLWSQFQQEGNAPQPQTKEEMWKRNEQFRDSAERVPVDIASQMKQQATRPVPSDLAGSKTYRAATTLSPLVPFLNPEASEKASDVGDTGAVAAENAIPAAAALIPAGAKYGYEKGVVGTRPARATVAYQRGVLPDTMGAADRAEAVSHFEHASPYLARQERVFPTSRANPYIDSAEAADAAGQNLWRQSVEPAIHTYGRGVVAAHPVANRIMAEFSPLDNVMRPDRMETARQLADHYSRAMSISEISDELTQLNNDRQLAAYHRMDDTARASADLDPSNAPLRAKLAAQNGLRDLLFDSLEQRMGPNEAAAFQQARHDFGSLKEVERRYIGASTPAPTTRTERVFNTVRAPRTAAYDSLLRNPKADALKSMRLLGGSKLEPPAPPQLTIPGAGPQGPRGLLDNPDAPGGNTPHVDIPFTQPGGTPISRQLGEGEPGWQWRGPASPVPGPQSGPGVAGYTPNGPEASAPLQLPAPVPGAPSRSTVNYQSASPMGTNEPMGPRPSWTIRPPAQGEGTLLENAAGQITGKTVPPRAGTLALPATAPPSLALPSGSVAPNIEVPSQPINPQEIEDLSRELGRPISAAELLDIRRRLAAEKNVAEGLRGNRRDVTGEIREAHRSNLKRLGP